MVENGMYFGTQNFYNLIRRLGGQWNDSKERPLVCMVKSVENPDLFWAIPVGNWNHRDANAKKRIKSYMNHPNDDISSCYYHVGNTDVTSIFFISDVVPITTKYIEREYLGRFTNQLYVIKNNQLISEINRKLNRILAFENSSPNYFRQHITDIKNYLLSEIQ